MGRRACSVGWTPLSVVVGPRGWCVPWCVKQQAYSTVCSATKPSSSAGAATGTSRGLSDTPREHLEAVGSAALLTRDVGVDRHVGPGPLRSPEIDICEKHDRRLEVARSPGGEHVRLGEADLGRGPASPQLVVAQLREWFGNVDPDLHLERCLA
jgi:hypothetical protein